MGFSGATKLRSIPYVVLPMQFRNDAALFSVGMSLTAKKILTLSRYTANNSSSGRNSCRLPISWPVLNVLPAAVPDAAVTAGMPPGVAPSNVVVIPSSSPDEMTLVLAAGSKPLKTHPLYTIHAQ